jgi:hypothetical protein
MSGRAKSSNITGQPNAVFVSASITGATFARHPGTAGVVSPGMTVVGVASGLSASPWQPLRLVLLQALLLSGGSCFSISICRRRRLCATATPEHQKQDHKAECHGIACRNS